MQPIDEVEEEDVELLPPELLNEENKQFSEKVKEEQLRQRGIKNKLEDQKDRITVLDDHLKKVKNEIYYTQVLVSAKEKEIETENHFRMMSEREIGRFHSELNKMDGESSKIQDSIDNTKNEIFKGNEKLDKFKLQMNFNQEELEQWILAEKQKEDDLIAIEKYKRKDDQKISEVTLDIEKLQRKLDRVKHLFGEEITKTKSCQIEMDKTARDFRFAHVERNELVEKYEDATKIMKKREDEIEEKTKLYNEQRANVRETEEEIIRLQGELEKHKGNSRETNNLIAKVSRRCEKLKIELEEKKKVGTTVGDEIEVQKNTLSKARSDLISLKEQVKVLTKRKVKELRKLKAIQSEAENKKQEIESQSEVKLKTEERNKKIEKQLEMTQKKFDHLVKILRDLKDVHYKKSEELFKVRKDETNLVAEISGTRAQIKNLQAKIVQMDQKAYKQQELVYNIGYSIQQMERRVNRAQGQRTQEQTEKLKKTIKSLNEQLEGTEKKNAVLTSEWKKAQGEVRKCSMEVKQGESQRDKLREVVHELALQNSSHEKEIEALESKKDEIMVNHDVLKLQLKRLNDNYLRRNKEVCGLENRYNQLELTLEEKVVQLESIKKMLINDLNSSKDQKRKIILDLNTRVSKLEKLKNKFGIMIKRIKTDDDGEEITQAGFLIRAIQEREELQRKGDVLDQQIQKLEAQMDGIDRTLLLFREHNKRHLSSQKRPNVGDESYNQKRELEEEINRIESIIGQKIQNRNVHTDNLEDVQKRNILLSRRNDLLERETNETCTRTDQLKNERVKLDEQWKRKKQAKNNYLQKFTIHSKNEKENTINLEKKKKVKNLEQIIRNENVVSLLRLVCGDDRTLESTLERLLEEHDIKSRHSIISTSRPSTAHSQISNISSTSSTPRKRKSDGNNTKKLVKKKKKFEKENEELKKSVEGSSSTKKRQKATPNSGGVKKKNKRRVSGVKKIKKKKNERRTSKSGSTKSTPRNRGSRRI